MTKKNFAAWHINKNEFSEDLSNTEKLIFFARYAVLAPSGHNTQPWEIVPGPDGIGIGINQAHYLSVDGSGLLSVEPYISIGTFLEVFNLAAKGFGYNLKIRPFPNDRIVANIALGSRVAAEPSLLQAITTRVSNRNFFEKAPIDTGLLASLSSKSLHGVETTVVTDRDNIGFIAEQTGKAIASIMSKPLYRKELSHWVRTNQTNKFDGMPGFTHGFGTVKSLISKPAVRHLPSKGPQVKHSMELINNSGALVIVRCTNEDKASFVNAGRMYSRICILANQSGFASSALGASVLDPDTREQIKEHLDIKDRPIYILRLGKATKPARHSPRWPVNKVTTKE